MSEISDDEQLHRRIHPMQVKDDGTISTAAFTDPEMSVDRAQIWTAQRSLEGHPGMGIAAFTAGFARTLKEPQEVVPDVTELFRPAHALVKGKKPKATQKQLARGSSLVVRPAMNMSGALRLPAVESAAEAD
ncbi:MAG: hypothetical protein IPI49_14760 [Myxococcales bacterium]|nr:hypothetical protein [Myxococcales bacterium]